MRGVKDCKYDRLIELAMLLKEIQGAKEGFSDNLKSSGLGIGILGALAEGEAKAKREIKSLIN